jgi:hypothetical protein
LKPPGKDAVGTAAPIDASLHHGPDAHQAGVDLGIAAPVVFVGAHQLRDRQALALRDGQQFLAAVERMAQRRRVGRDHLLPAAVVRHFVADDEAAAHRVVDAVGKFVAARTEGDETHAVGVEGQGFAAMEDQVGRRFECDRVAARQRQPALGPHGIEQRRDRVDVHRVGLVTGQTEQHGLVAAVTLAGGAERPVEQRLHAPRALEQAVVRQSQREHARGAHRPHGVRAARTDADLEEIEDADRHAAIISTGRRATGSIRS